MRLLGCVAMLLAAVSAHGQTVQRCRAAKLRTTVLVYHAPDHIQVIAGDYTNEDWRPCSLEANAVVDGQYSNRPDVVLGPGGVAHSSFRYRTQAVESGGKCVGGGLFSRIGPANVLLDSATLAPLACSKVESDPILAGPFVPDWKGGDAGVAASSAPILRATKQSFYEHEIVDLRVTLTNRAAGDLACPTLLEDTRDEKGEERIDEVMSPKRGCQRGSTGRDGSKGPANEFQIYEGGNSAWEGLGERSFTVLQVGGDGSDGEVQLIASNTLQVQIIDPATVERNWGAAVKGVRVALTLDRLEYALGEDIPLHIATEDVSAKGIVYENLCAFGTGVCFGPSDGPAVMIDVSVVGPDGPLTRGFTGYGATFGPAAHPVAYEKGKPRGIEKSLTRIGLLPAKAGDYTIVVTWSPSLIQNGGSVGMKPFVTVSSVPMVVRITDAPASK